VGVKNAGALAGSAFWQGTDELSENSKLNLTQTIVGVALKRTPNGKFTPNALRDYQVGGLLLVVGTRTATWCVDYKPHGTREDGRRHSKVRMTLGDATTMPLSDARTAARAVKVEVAKGRDPHAEKRAGKAKAIAERASKPTTLTESLKGYEQDMLKRREPSEATRRQEVHYARKAVAKMEAGALAVDRLDAGVIRKLIRTMDSSDSEVRHAFGALSRFFSWMIEEGLIEANPCDAVPRKQRPKPGRDRLYVPSLEELRAIWTAVEDEHVAVRDLVRFAVLTPLRRDEIAELTWGEVDVGERKLKLPAGRMKNRLPHDMPLSDAAHEIIVRRRGDKERKVTDLVFPSSEGTAYSGWTRLLTRIRKAIGQGEARRDARFSLHDIRRGFSTHLGDRGHDEIALDLALAHKRTRVHGVYQRADRWRDRVGAVNAWADLITGAVEKVDNVLPFSRSV
jgi:integrase